MPWIAHTLGVFLKACYSLEYHTWAGYLTFEYPTHTQSQNKKSSPKLANFIAIVRKANSIYDLFYKMTVLFLILNSDYVF